MLTKIHNFLTWVISVGGVVFLGYVTYANTRILQEVKARALELKQPLNLGFTTYAQIYLPFVIYTAIFVYTLLEYKKTKQVQILTLAPLALLFYMGIINLYQIFATMGAQ